MDILVYGAGVLGSLYAARLQEAGNAVTVLARGQRLADIREHGLVLEDATTGQQAVTRVNVVDQLTPDDAYDLVIVLVRKNQLASVLPALAANHHTPTVLFMVNTAAGPGEMIAALGRERVVLGFPGAGGTRVGHSVRCRLVSGKAQPTTLGELYGFTTRRLAGIAESFKAAGFPVALCPYMAAWLKTHVALVSPIANALYLAAGDNYRLAHTRDGVVLMVRAIREGLRVLHALDVPITPARYRSLEWIPEPLLVAVMQRILDTSRAELIMARHANAARDEMQHLADEFRTLVHQAGVPTPALDRLNAYLDPAVPPIEQGAAHIPLDWRGVWLGLGVLAGLILLAIGMRKREVTSVHLYQLEHDKNYE